MPKLPCVLPPHSPHESELVSVTDQRLVASLLAVVWSVLLAWAPPSWADILIEPDWGACTGAFITSQDESIHGCAEESPGRAKRYRTKGAASIRLEQRFYEEQAKASPCTSNCISHLGGYVPNPNVLRPECSSSTLNGCGSYHLNLLFADGSLGFRPDVTWHISAGCGEYSTTLVARPWSQDALCLVASGECPGGTQPLDKGDGDTLCARPPVPDPNSGSPPCREGNPCNPATGNKFQEEHDSEGLTPLTRYYNSSHSPWAASAQMAPGWSHTYSGRIAWEVPHDPSDSDPPIAIFRPDGRFDRFYRTSESLFTSRNDSRVKLELRPLVIVIVLPTGAEEHYHRVSGRLQALIDPAGRRTELFYAQVSDLHSQTLDRVVGPFGHTLDFTYDTVSGRLVGVMTPGLDRLAYEYDSLGNLVFVKSYPNGASEPMTTRQYHYDYAAHPDTNRRHALTRITDENGDRFARFDYSASGQVILTEHAPTDADPATNPDQVGQGRRTFAYDIDADGNPRTTVTDAKGSQREYVFTDGTTRRMPKSITLRDGTSVRSVDEYDLNNRPLAVVDERGTGTVYRYDKYHETLRIEAPGTPHERFTSYTYLEAASGLVTTVTEPSVFAPTTGGPRFRVTTTTYADNPDVPGAKLRVPESIRIDGFDPVSGRAVYRETKLTWSPLVLAGHTEGTMFLTSVDGPREDLSDKTTFEYYLDCPGAPAHCGRLGQLKQVARVLPSAAEHVTRFESYDEHGRLTRERDPNGLLTRYQYDYRGRLTERRVELTDGNTFATTYTYDGAGQLTAVTGPDNTSLTYRYDAAHQLRSVEDDLGNRVHYGYDLNGNRTTEEVENAEGVLRRVESRAYDPRERLEHIVRAHDGTRFGYDGTGNLVRTTDAKGQRRTASFDPLNRLIQTTDPLPAAGVTDFTYDAKDRLTSVTDALARTTTYVYDDLGNLRMQSSLDSGVTLYDYDHAGNTVSKTDARGVQTTYEYDALNRLVGYTYPIAIPGIPESRTVTLAYDTGPNGLGRLTRMHDEFQGTSEFDYNYEYDQRGNRTRERNTIAGVTYDIEYAPDNANRPSSVTYPSGTEVIYARDGSGRIDTVTLTAPGQAPTVMARGIQYEPFGPAKAWVLNNGLLVSRGFDQRYQLDEISAGSLDWSIKYDPNGNIAGITDWTDASRTQAITYDQADRIDVAVGFYGTRDFDFDAIGNRTGVVFSGDPLGLTSSNADSSLELLYDEANRMVEARLAELTAATYLYNGSGERIAKTVGPTTTIYHYGESGKLLAESASDGTTLVEYVYLNGEPLARVEPTGGVPIVHYYLNDHLGTPQRLVDENQLDVWNAAYTPFGTADVAPTSTAINNLRFPGQYFDAETGLHYNYFRDYDPSIGRYMQSDPIGLDAGLNTYLYATANPLRFTDPTGLISDFRDEAMTLIPGSALFPDPGGSVMQELPSDGAGAGEDIRRSVKRFVGVASQRRVCEGFGRCIARCVVTVLKTESVTAAVSKKGQALANAIAKAALAGRIATVGRISTGISVGQAISCTWQCTEL